MNNINYAEKCYVMIDRLLAGVGGIEGLLTHGLAVKLKAKGFMDLNIEAIGPSRIAMSHNFIQNGDVMADPDMEVSIFRESKVAVARTYQLDSLGVYESAESKRGDGTVFVNVTKSVNLSKFLFDWLKNIKAQGHALPSAEEMQKEVPA